MREDLKDMAAAIQSGMAYQMHPDKFAVWLEEVVKDAEARGLRKAAQEIDWEWEVVMMEDGNKSIGQHGKNPDQLLNERADRLDATRVIRANPIETTALDETLSGMEDRAANHGSAMNVFQTSAWATQVAKDNERLIAAARAFEKALKGEDNGA